MLWAETDENQWERSVFDTLTLQIRTLGSYPLFQVGHNIDGQLQRIYYRFLDNRSQRSTDNYLAGPD